MKPNKLYIDQYGDKFWARTVKELCEKIGVPKARKMYDDFDGRSYQVGYVIGEYWLLEFTPTRKEA